MDTEIKGIYPSGFTYVLFRKRIEFSNVIFHKKDLKIVLH